MVMSIQVGIIGFGMSAQTFHVPLLSALPDFDIAAFCSSQSHEILRRWPSAHCVMSVEDLVQLPELDLIVVCSPSGLHYQHALMALQANKHVVVEKPFTLSRQQAAELFDCAQKNDRVLTAFHNRRWDGDFLTVKRLLNNHTLGDVRYFESHFDRFRPVIRDRWRENAGAGSGILYDLGPHLIDQAVSLFGLPLRVTATIQAQRQNAQADDYVHIQLHYNDLEVVLHADMLNAGPNPRFRVQGTGGTYIKNGLDPQENQLEQGISPFALDYGQTLEDEHGHVYNELGSAQVITEKGEYLSFYRQLADAITNKQVISIDSQSILQVMQIIDCALASHQQARTVNVNDFACSLNQ